jgi:hypothetical protein
MAALHAQNIKAHRTGFGPLGSDAMAECFLGVLGHQSLELRLVLAAEQAPTPRSRYFSLIDN